MLLSEVEVNFSNNPMLNSKNNEISVNITNLFDRQLSYSIACRINICNKNFTSISYYLEYIFLLIALFDCFARR